MGHRKILPNYSKLFSPFCDVQFLQNFALVRKTSFIYITYISIYNLSNRQLIFFVIFSVTGEYSTRLRESGI